MDKVSIAMNKADLDDSIQVAWMLYSIAKAKGETSVMIELEKEIQLNYVQLDTLEN